jgi:hypothetical protein
MQLLSRIGVKPSAAVALTAIALVSGLAATSAQAVVVYSGPVSIAVPDNLDGIYLNVVTGTSGTSGFDAPGWDINPYSALAGQFNLWGPTTTTWLSPSGAIGGPYPLAAGTSIDASGIYTRPGGGTNVGTQVALNAPNLFGFRFTNEDGGTTHFGWVEVSFGATAGLRTITGYAFESTPGVGIQAGVVPEPATVAMMLAGLAGVGAAARRARKS